MTLMILGGLIFIAPVKASAAKKYVICGFMSGKEKVKLNIKKRTIKFTGKWGKGKTASKAFRDGGYEGVGKTKLNIKLKISPKCKITGDLPKQNFLKFAKKYKSELTRLTYYVKNGTIYKVYSSC